VSLEYSYSILYFVYHVILARYAHLLTLTSSKVSRDTTLPILPRQTRRILTFLQKAILVSHPVLIGPRPLSKGLDPLSLTSSSRIILTILLPNRLSKFVPASRASRQNGSELSSGRSKSFLVVARWGPSLTMSARVPSTSGRGRMESTESYARYLLFLAFCPFLSFSTMI
jgi:hypothetical protein